jgi:hypothetical protein
MQGEQNDKKILIVDDSSSARELEAHAKELGVPLERKDPAAAPTNPMLEARLHMLNKIRRRLGWNMQGRSKEARPADHAGLRRPDPD